MSVANKRYNGIQLLRAILFVGIVAFHSGVPGSQMLWGGIEVFFVISSYFLTKKISRVSASEIEIIPNIKHRFVRLIPVYYLVLIGAFLVIAVIKQIFPIVDLLIHSIFSQNINWMITGYQSPLIPFTAHTWTLSIEVYLYIVWLFAFKFLKTNRSRLIFNLVSILCAVAWRILTTMLIGDPMITSLCPIAHMDAFALGSLMSMSEAGKEKVTRPLNWTLGVCGLVIIVCSICITAYLNKISFGGAYILYKSSENYLNNVLTCNVYLGFSLLTVGLVQFLKLFKADGKLAKGFVALGNYTYTGYLVHYPIIVLLKRYIDSRWIVFFVTTILTVLCSVVVKKIIDRIRKRFKKCSL